MHVPQYKLSKTAAPFLSRVELESGKTDTYDNVTGTIIPIYVFQEVFKRSLFSSSKHHINDFTVNGIVSVQRDCRETRTKSEDRPIKITVLEKFVRNRKILQNVITTNFNEAVICRTKASKEYYFNMLRYSSIFPKGKPVLNRNLIVGCCREKKEVYSKPSMINTEGLRDASW